MDFMKENVGGAAAAPGMDAAIDRAARMTACRRATDNAPAPLADLSMVGWLHGEFERECRVDDPVERRRMFVFIFALLYAPAALAGRRLPHGMRQALSSAVPDVAPCRLSCHPARGGLGVRPLPHVPRRGGAAGGGAGGEGVREGTPLIDGEETRRWHVSTESADDCLGRGVTWA